MTQNWKCTWAVAALGSVALAGSVAAQDRLPSMPGYEQWARMAPQIAQAIPGRGFGRGGVAARWSPDGKTVDFTNGGKQFRYDFVTRKIGDVPPTPQAQAGRAGRGMAMPERGRQFDFAIAPRGNHRAIYRDRNVWLADSTGANAVPITTDGSEKTRIKYGTASWVYGEELSQRTAMWWSPDGSKLAFYRFDESRVPDFYLATRLTAIQDTIDVEAYPKPGVPNPVVDLYVYDVATKKTTRIDVRDGKPFENATLGYYVYAVDWSPDSRELYFLRTNRRQNTLEMAACAPTTGKCRVVVHDEWLSGWIDTDPAPEVVWLKDGNRFIWESDRTGFKNYYLYDFKAGKLLNPITRLNAEVSEIVRVDEAANTLWYMGRDGSNYMKFQLHRVKLDGTDDERLTDPAFNHTVSLAPDGKHFIDVAETHDQAPVTRLLDASGKVVSDKHFVFFNNLKSPDGSVEHTGDNLTGEGEGDDEVINVNLAGVPAEVDKIVFAVSIYDAETRQQSFGQVRNAYIRIVNQAGGAEIARYDLSEDASTETAMIFGEVYRNQSEWKFRAVGQGYSTGLRGIAQDYGVNVG